MNPNAVPSSSYSSRQVRAAHRVLVDIGQVLASFRDAIVIVGGWVPDLLFDHPEPSHIGSIDVDLALDGSRLDAGRYAELLGLLLETGRYHQGSKEFQLTAQVDLGDGESAVQVEVDFLASSEVRLRKTSRRRIENFRVLQFPACAAAFESPVERIIHGQMISGAQNVVSVRVASICDLIIMKAHAIGGRDKSKDVYDLCFCLDNYPGGIDALSLEWRNRPPSPISIEALQILQSKFQSVSHYGPRQLVQFHTSHDPDEDAMLARRAFELVNQFLKKIL